LAADFISIYRVVDGRIAEAWVEGLLEVSSSWTPRATISTAVTHPMEAISQAA
jgi:hypothetical protein